MAMSIKLSSGMLCHAVWWIGSDVGEESAADTNSEECFLP